MSAPATGATADLLVVMPNWLGDTLFATPSLRALRRAYPQARIDCAVPQRCEEVLRHNPHLDRVIVYDDKPRWSRPSSIRGLWRLMGERRYAGVVFLSASTLKSACAALRGIRRRVGPAHASKLLFLTDSAGTPAPDAHRIDHYLAVARAAGAVPDGRSMDFVPEPAAEASAGRLLAPLAGRPYVTVHAGGNWDLKRWPAGSFGAWSSAYLERTERAIVYIGTDAERPLVASIAAGRDPGRALDLCGRTSLSELAWVLRGSRLLLTNDSGPIHLAATQRVPTVGLFGPTSPDRTGPVTDAPLRILTKDVGCEVPCYFRGCDLRVCMDWIGVDEVLEACLSLGGRADA